jgi:hypothetical protein
MLGLGFGLAFVAEPLGAYWGNLAFLVALVMIFAGVPLLVLYLIVYGALWVLRKVGTTTGVVVVEEEPPPPAEPVSSGPSWRVTLPDGPHTVYLEDDRPQPKRLVCDGRWVELTWPRKWRGNAEGLFKVSGHPATLGVAPDWQRSLSLGSLIGAIGGGAAAAVVFRHDLRVDGASVAPLAPEAPPPSKSIESG